MSMDFEKSLADLRNRIDELKKLNADSDVKFDAEIAELEQRFDGELKKLYSDLTPWQTVHVARHKDRPLMQDYISGIFTGFIELHGDRAFGDDRAMVCGLASIEDEKVVLIGTEKGKTVEEKVKRNFGMAHPEGYRKALRVMRLAEKFRLPVVSLIDTPAAYPGADAEARGQAEAIARNITEMIGIETPIIVVITGEGGSGGALGIGVGDVVMVLSNSIYSVIPPEGCAAILFRDAAKAEEAARALRITSRDLKALGVIDEIIAEPQGGAHRDYDATMAAVKSSLLKHIKGLKHVSRRRLLERRFEKYARIGRPA